MTKKRPNAILANRPAFLLGAALLLTTLAVAQHALDANLRVGSGGRNTHRPQATMSKSIYTVGRGGDLVYNRSAAFNDSVYSRPTTRHQQRIGNSNPKPLGRASANANPLSRGRYSAGRSARSTSRASARASAQVPIVRGVHRTKSSATLQRPGYSPGRALNAMQAPTLNLSQRSYSASGASSRPVRSR